jgi:proteic killer suppression protein
VKIRNVIHKGLRRFILNDDDAGLPAAVVSKVGKIVSFLQDMEEEGELRTVPSWKAHQMTGDRKGTWSLFVTRNWRITFRIDKAEIQIIDLDCEDYH